MVDIVAGSTSQSIDIFIQDSSSTTGQGLAALVYNTSSLAAYYRKGATGTATAITLATQTVGGAYSSGGFVEIQATNMKGLYRLDIPNAVVDTEGHSTICVYGAANMAPTFVRIDCKPKASNTTQFGGVAGTFSSGRPETNTTHWGGTAVASATVNANTTQISGDSTAADNAESFFDGTGYAGTNNVIPTVTTLTNLPAITSNWLTAAGVADGALDRASFAADTGLQSIRSNTAQAGASGSITLDASASSTTDFYVGAWVFLTGGTGVGQTRLITAYNGTTKVATVASNWATNPDNTSTFAILPSTYIEDVQNTLDVNVTQIGGGTQSATDLKDFADDGYDPSTNKVQGVVLTDTVTTYTGNSLQTGDGYAIVNNGTYGNSALKTLVDTKPTLAQILAGGDIDGYTLEQTLKLCLSALAAKLSGAAGTTITIRATDDSKDRITATVDSNGNRTAVTLDATG